MSQFRRSVAVAATLAAVVALPATASAKTDKAVSKTSVTVVKKTVSDAQTSVKRLKRAVRLGQSTVAKRQLKLARTQTANASRVARRLANSASTGDAASTAAQALTMAGTQYDSLLETLTGLVDDGPAQGLIAGAIQPTIAGKTQILQVLTSLMNSLPASAQPQVAAIIAALGAGDATEVVNLDNALDVGTLPDTITDLVTQCVQMATQAIQSALDMVQSILPMLPVGAQAPIGTILSQVTGIIGTLVPSVLSTVTGLIDTIIGALPIVGSGSGPLGGLLSGILGSSAGATGAIPGAGNIGSTITGLLGGLLGGGSGSGSSPISGIVGTVTGLINSLLGGLLGGLVPAT
jgi:hypothetical protein